MYILLFLIVPAVFAFFACKTDKYILKTLQTLACLFIAAYAGLLSGSPYFWYLAAAFLVSVFGDYFLSYKSRNENYFVYGIILYFLAHIGYLLYIVISFNINIMVFILSAAVLLAGYLAYYFVSLKKSIEGLMVPAVLAYLIISCIVLAFAASSYLPALPKVFLIAGIALIVISDTIIAESNFLSHSRFAFLILPTYYAAQISLCASFIILNFT